MPGGLCTERSSERVEWRIDKGEGGGLRRTDKVEGGAQLIVTVNWGDFIVVQAREWLLVAWVGWGMVQMALVTGLEELTVIVKSLVPWSWGSCSTLDHVLTPILCKSCLCHAPGLHYLLFSGDGCIPPSRLFQLPQQHPRQMTTHQYG